MLNTKITGRRTNQESMNQFYPSDSSFNRITNLIGRPFDFGAPVTKTAATQVSTPASSVDTTYYDGGAG
jgi:hypothetical protein